jgi:hypothetical protein
MTPALLPRGTASAAIRLLTPEPERELPRDPVKWASEELHEHPWSIQRQIMRSVVEHRYTAVPSCYGAGKDWTAARTAAYWIAAHEPGEAFVVTTGPTTTQVKAILWRELARAHRKGDLPGDLIGMRGQSVPEWHVGPKGDTELVAFGRTPKDLTDKEAAKAAFTGIHARYVLVIYDEAGGIPPWLWEAGDGLLTSAASRALAIGNPGDPSSRFAEVCRPGSGWNVIPISAFDTPNLSGEAVPEALRHVLVSKEWVEERRQRWGEESALWQSKVLGQFPDTSDDLVVSPSLVTKGHMTELDGMELGAYGLDVARYGQNESVIYRSRGGVIRLEEAWRKSATTVTEGKAKRILARHGGVDDPQVPMAIDADGIGGGVYDHLAEDGYGVHAYHGGVAAIKSRAEAGGEAFADRRSESWWNFREDLADGYIDLDPADDDLADQLQKPRWSTDSKGRIKVESKKEMAKRGVPSPDRADAAIMARDLDRVGIGLAERYGTREELAQRAVEKSITGDLLDLDM